MIIGIDTESEIAIFHNDQMGSRSRSFYSIFPTFPAWQPAYDV